MTTLAEVTKRVIAEYLQVPALHLKAEQVQRLCRIEPAMCQLALDALVAAKFLRLTSHGRYARVTEGCSDTGPQPVPSDGIVTAVDPRSERETLVLRQPERRRYRSDAELRAERAERERQWHSRDTRRSGAGIAERV